MLRALVSVFIGWNIIALSAGALFSDQPLDLIYSLVLFLMVMAAAGAFAALSFTDFDLFDSEWKGLLGRAAGQTRFEIKNSMGALPTVRFYLAATPGTPAQELCVKRARIGDMTMWWDPQLRGWWNRYRASHPDHAAVMTACAEFLQANRSVPATFHPQGHGGASLIDHSQNVVLMMHRHCAEWRYTGHHNKAGAKMFELLDRSKPSHAFDADDPLPPLAAFAHDIGKAICYQEGKAGVWTEVHADHDTIGARILRMLPECERLDTAELMRLLIAVGYYHKISRIPGTPRIDDRARSLTELLYRVDNLTGIEEAKGRLIGTSEDAQGPVDNAEPALLGNAQPAIPVPFQKPMDEADVAQSTVHAWDQSTGVQGIAAPASMQDFDTAAMVEPDRAELWGELAGREVEPEVSYRAGPQRQAGPPPQHAESISNTLSSWEAPSMDHGLRFEALLALLQGAQHGSGNPRGRGLAYRFGDWAYLMMDEIIAGLQANGYPVPEELLHSADCASIFEQSICRVLEDKQALFRLHAGKYYPPSASIFLVKKEPSASVARRAIIALATSIDVEHSEEAKHPSFIAEPVFPSQGESHDQLVQRALVKRQATVGKSPSKKKDLGGPLGDPLVFDASLLFAWQTSNPGSNPMVRTDMGSLFLVEAVEAMNMLPPQRSSVAEHEGRSYYLVPKSPSRRR
ncbi:MULTISPECIES: hypothetical protein [Acidovorax]|uniref:HD domain-containing protein n=1 Tax=Acidovorax facilis TaxID=12917 RepID=A0ABV8DJL6_9BURK|nr:MULTISPECIES: hypothetical protein [Acidovorax]KQB57319.1 hypothetical protein AE621_21320 [Acidovorax sp. SD340]MBO1008188.1 hypothetical protein [Acidovorax sp. SD340]MCO4241706.1 hypothetical protein [Acidovorax facilis]